MTMNVLARMRSLVGLRAEAAERLPVADFTEQVLASSYARAVSTLRADGLAAVEAGVGVIERAFRAAEVRGVSGQLRGGDFAWAVRRMLTFGQAAAAFYPTAGGGWRIMPAASVDVSGGSTAESDWLYRLQFAAPSGWMRTELRGRQVLHWRYSVDPGMPWRGQSPLDRAVATSATAAALESVVRTELRIPVGRIIAMPSGAPAELVDGLKKDLREVGGRVAMPETTAGGFGAGLSSAPRRDYVPERIAPDVAGYSAMREQFAEHLLGAIGVAPVLALGGRGGANARREAWRVCLHGTIMPMAANLADEFQAKTGERLTFDFRRLAASDIAGRARAYKQLVDAGMTASDAAAATGLAE